MLVVACTEDVQRRSCSQSQKGFTVQYVDKVVISSPQLRNCCRKTGPLKRQGSLARHTCGFLFVCLRQGSLARHTYGFLFVCLFNGEWVWCLAFGKFRIFELLGFFLDAFDLQLSVQMWNKRLQRINYVLFHQTNPGSLPIPKSSCISGQFIGLLGFCFKINCYAVWGPFSPGLMYVQYSSWQTVATKSH